jgi:hypothetical protein
MLIVLVLIGTGCAYAAPLQPRVAAVENVESGSPAAPTAPAPVPSEPAPPVDSAPETLEPIVLTLSVYILDDATGDSSSARTAEGLADVYQKANDIWSQAGIVLEVQTITRTNVSSIYLEAIAGRDFSHFFSGVRGGEIEVPDPSLLNGFYAQDIGGPNGITPFGSRVFFVTDAPSVHSERVSSHEVGHILGLHHVLDDQNRLMFPGTNGMRLSDQEIRVARYAAQGLLAGVR